MPDRLYPTYSVVVTKPDATVLDITHACADVTIERTASFRYGTAKIVAGYGKDLAPGIALAAVEEGDTVVVMQVPYPGSATPAGVVFTGKVVNPGKAVKGPLISATIDCADALKTIQCTQIDMVMTVAVESDVLVESLFAAWLPAQARTITASPFMVEPIVFRSISMLDILNYISSVSGEAFWVDAGGTFRWASPNTLPSDLILTTLMPVPTIEKGTAAIQEDATRLYNSTKAYSAGNLSSNKYVFRARGDGSSTAWDLPFRPAEPIDGVSAIEAVVRDIWTGIESPLQIGLAYKTQSSYSNGGVPTTGTTIPWMRLLGGSVGPIATAIWGGATETVVSQALWDAAALTPGPGGLLYPAEVPTITMKGGSAGGAGTGGWGGPPVDLLVNVAPGEPPSVRLKKAIGPTQELVVKYFVRTPETPTLKNTTSIAADGEAQYTLQGPRLQSAATAMQIQAALLAELGAPVLRGGVDTNQFQRADMLDPLARVVRLTLPELGIDRLLPVTAATRQWRSGKVSTLTLSFGPSDQIVALEQILQDNENRIKGMESDLKTAAAG